MALFLQKISWLLILSLLVSGCNWGRAAEKVPKATLAPYISAQTDLQFTSWLEFPADIILIVDQSGSMSRGKNPTDPNNLRIKSSLAFVEFIARRSNQANPDRLGVVNFGTEAPRNLAVPLTPITSSNDPNVSAIQDRLKPLDLGDTSFIKAFQLATQLFREANSFQQSRNRAIVIFTDGEPDDPRKLGLERYFAELSAFIKEQIKPNNVEVFIVGIDTAGKVWSATVSYWQDLLGEDYVLTLADLESLPEKFSEIVQLIYKLPPQKPVLLHPGLQEEFDVPPYLASLEFFIFPSQPDATVRIFRPDGKVVQPGVDPDTPPLKKLRTCDLIVMQEPEPGVYQYEAVGAEVRIVRNFIPFQVRLISPLPVHPQGKVMRFIAEFKRTDGKAVSPHPDYPLGLFANVVTPLGERISVKFFPKEEQEGIYFGDSEIPVTTPGDYTISLKVVGGNKYQNEFPVTVQVRPIPYLVIEEPREEVPIKPSLEITVKARLFKADRLLSPEEEFSVHPDYIVLAQVVQSPSGGRGQTIWLPYRRETGLFEGLVPVPGEKGRVQEGHYTLAVKLAPGGEEVSKDQAVVSFVMKEPPPPFWMRIVRQIPIFVIPLIVALVLIRYLRRSRLRMYLYYWVEGAATFRPMVFERANESKDLTPYGVPVKVEREGVSKRVVLRPLGEARLLTADGREVPEVRVDRSTAWGMFVQAEGGKKVGLNVGFESSQLIKPRAYPEEEILLSEQSQETPSPEERPMEEEERTDWNLW